MKTKLFLFTTLICSFLSNAQIQAPSVGTLVALNITQNSARLQFNVNRNGSNTNYSVIYSKSPNLNPSVGQTPSGPLVTVFGWQTRFFDISGLQPNTTYYWQVTTSNGLGVTQSVIANFVTSAVPTIPSITALSTSNITHNAATIHYSLNANTAASTSVVKYGIDASSLLNQTAGFSATGISLIDGNVNITGLAPRTIYFYNIEATNSFGTTTSIVRSFTTSNSPSITSEYRFDNSFHNAAGNSPFSATNTSFVNNRAGQAQSAIRVGSTTDPLTATVADLPLASAERTVSFWHKKPTHTVAVGLFAYGTNAAGKTFGLYLATNGNYVFQTFVNDVIFSGSATAANTWVHSVITFKSGVVKLYNNGTLVASANATLNTENSTFRLGGNGAIVEFDDLQIYNYELTAAQVTELYTTNTVLSSNDFSQNNLKVSLYPNPVNDILNIETETEIKSVDIYNLQGQKVKTAVSKQVNVADLASGVYMVRIQDENNAEETRKIIKQ